MQANKTQATAFAHKNSLRETHLLGLVRGVLEDRDVDGHGGGIAHARHRLDVGLLAQEEAHLLSFEELALVVEGHSCLDQALHVGGLRGDRGELVRLCRADQLTRVHLLEHAVGACRSH